jgi:hypothetical protein
MKSIFDLSRSPILNAVKSNKKKATACSLAIVALSVGSGITPSPESANAASYGGSCYRYDSWRNGWNGFCPFPTGGGTYSNMRSVSWTGGNGARITWRPNGSNSSGTTCDISSGRTVCNNPYGQGNVSFDVQPYNNQTTTYFNLNSY